MEPAKTDKPQEGMELVRPKVFQTMEQQNQEPTHQNPMFLMRMKTDELKAKLLEESPGSILPSTFPTEIHQVMSQRDWFAGQALVGVFTVDTRIVTREDADRLANNCYTLAEAMVRRSLQG